MNVNFSLTLQFVITVFFIKSNLFITYDTDKSLSSPIFIFFKTLTIFRLHMFVLQNKKTKKNLNINEQNTIKNEYNK